ncbi:hypothetical protein LINPERHAP1_LOCUS24181 [Linum perenne]
MKLNLRVNSNSHSTSLPSVDKEAGPANVGFPFKMMNKWMALPMWGRPMKDGQEGNPDTHDMASPVLAGGGGR